MNEPFANLDAWHTRPDGTVYQDTIWMVANNTIREGGGLRQVGLDELIDGKYPGALLASNAQYQYGYFECYCKFPTGYLWPAFFIYDELRNEPGHTKNEIDIFEWLGTNIIYITTHIVTQQWQVQVASAALGGVYHKWGCYWDAGAIRIYLDDHLIAETTNPAYIPTVPMNIDLAHTFDGWAQPPSNVTFPAYMDVDWVKVWVKDNTYR